MNCASSFFCLHFCDWNKSIPIHLIVIIESTATNVNWFWPPQLIKWMKLLPLIMKGWLLEFLEMVLPLSSDMVNLVCSWLIIRKRFDSVSSGAQYWNSNLVLFSKIHVRQRHLVIEFRKQALISSGSLDFATITGNLQNPSYLELLLNGLEYFLILILDK